MQVVLCCVGAVYDQVHAKLIDQVLKIFLHESGHDRNILHARLMQLADRPLNQPLAVHFDQGLGSGKINRHHPHARAGRQDDRAARRVAGDFFPGPGSQAAGSVQVTVRHQLIHRLVDRADRKAAGFGKGPLADKRSFTQRSQDHPFLQFQQVLR